MRRFAIALVLFFAIPSLALAWSVTSGSLNFIAIKAVRLTRFPFLSSAYRAHPRIVRARIAVPLW
jgi:hypothetical protein